MSVFLCVTISDLNQLTREELMEKCLQLYEQKVLMERMIYGPMRERFVPENRPMRTLFDQEDVTPAAPEPVTEEISYERKKPQKNNHEGRQLLSECTHLPVEREELPLGFDVAGMKKIGESVQEKLAYKPGKLYIRQYVRSKYIDPKDNKIVIADPVPEPIAKCEADVSLIVFVLISKFVDHLPEYRIIEILKRSGVKIPASTINGWTHGVMKVLDPIGRHLLDRLRSTGYIQVDETRIRVQDGEKANSTHLGYMWYYHSPEQNIVLINYEQSRGREGPMNILRHYKGYIQTDGYEVYKSLAKGIAGIEHVGCMAHMRRYFERALDHYSQPASHVLEQIQSLYGLEERLRAAAATDEERFAARQEHARPVMEELHRKIEEYSLTATPKSTFGKAIAYSLNNWKAVSHYISNGRLEIDNNLIENKIRPLALGRKNFMFAGSHEAAARLALMYSIMGTCKANEVNPCGYLSWLLPKINEIKINDLARFTPMAYRKLFLNP